MSKKGKVHPWINHIIKSQTTVNKALIQAIIDWAFIISQKLFTIFSIITEYSLYKKEKLDFLIQYKYLNNLSLSIIKTKDKTKERINWKKYNHTVFICFKIFKITS